MLRIVALWSAHMVVNEIYQDVAFLWISFPWTVNFNLNCALFFLLVLVNLGITTAYFIGLLEH